jgi:hypothetical protein
MCALYVYMYMHVCISVCVYLCVYTIMGMYKHKYVCLDTYLDI